MTRYTSVGRVYLSHTKNCHDRWLMDGKRVRFGHITAPVPEWGGSVHLFIVGNHALGIGWMPPEEDAQ